MARGNNFYYQDPTAEIGSSLVRAIFGDPAAAAQQQRHKAEIAEREAHTRLYASQAAGQEGQNTAATSLPELIAQLTPRAPDPATVTTLDDPRFMDASVPSALQQTPDQAMRLGLPAVIAAMAQMQGDKASTSETIGTLASFLGGDEMARRGLVAQGHTPDKDFALTPERADAIARQGYDAEQAKAFGVADIDRRSAFDVATVNNRDDIPVANIQAAASRYGADSRAGSARYAADTKAGGGVSRGERNNNPGNIEMGAFAKSHGATGSDGRFAIFPSYEAGVRAQEALLAGPGYVGGGRNTIDAIISRYAPPGDGNQVGSYADYVSRVTGIPRNQAIGPAQIPAVAAAMRQFETGNTAPGKGGKSGAAAKPQKISKADYDLLGTAVDDYASANRVTLAPYVKASVLAKVVAAFQQNGGNVADAIRQGTALLSRQADGSRLNAPPARAQPPAKPTPRSASSAPPVPGARRAPDGNWYVVTGKNPDGTPKYGRVEQ